jgi:site-specific recombinase XerD
MIVKDRDRIQEEGLPHGECLSVTQLEILLRYVKDKADEARRKGATRAIINELIVALILRTGLRASELCNLNIRDLPESHGENTIWVRDTTENIARKVDIDSETDRILNKFVKLYRLNAKLEDPLFVSECGGRLPYMSLYSKLKILGQKAGIGKLHPEILRHTYLVRLYNATQDLRLVQLQAGHVHSASTARYVKNERQKDHIMSHGGDITPKTSNQSASPIREETRTRKSQASIPPTNKQVVEECEVCCKPVAAKLVTKIDSGQLLCPDCLNELRGYSL